MAFYCIALRCDKLFGRSWDPGCHPHHGGCATISLWLGLAHHYLPARFGMGFPPPLHSIIRLSGSRRSTGTGWLGSPQRPRRWSWGGRTRTPPPSWLQRWPGSPPPLHTSNGGICGLNLYIACLTPLYLFILIRLRGVHHLAVPPREHPT